MSKIIMLQTISDDNRVASVAVVLLFTPEVNNTSSAVAAVYLARSIAAALILYIDTGNADNSPQLLHLKPKKGLTDFPQFSH
jgi:hypothetical protein